MKPRGHLPVEPTPEDPQERSLIAEGSACWTLYEPQVSLHPGNTVF